MGEGIPALAIFFDLLIGRDPIQGGGLRGNRSRRQDEEREEGQKGFVVLNLLSKRKSHCNSHYSGRD